MKSRMSVFDWDRRLRDGRETGTMGRCLARAKSLIRAAVCQYLWLLVFLINQPSIMLGT